MARIDGVRRQLRILPERDAVGLRGLARRAPGVDRASMIGSSPTSCGRLRCQKNKSHQTATVTSVQPQNDQRQP